jgi:pimeloyl-ACP methyl ester carboxylesterase
MLDRVEKHCVVLIHGIRTRALWMGEVKETLRSHDLIVESSTFGKFSLFKFLLPLPFARRQAIRRIQDDIDSIIALHEPDKLSIIAHSFGTMVVLNVIINRPSAPWYRIVLCGSVLKENFPLGEIIRAIKPPILNEVGECDGLPALAESVTWGYGSIGSHGIQRPGTETRWHSNLKHSDFLKAPFVEQYWIPFLLFGTIRPGDKPSRPKGIIANIAKFPFKFFYFFVLFLIVFLFWHPKVEPLPEYISNAFVEDGEFLSYSKYQENAFKWSVKIEYRYDEGEIIGKTVTLFLNKIGLEYNKEELTLQKVHTLNPNKINECVGYIFIDRYSKKYFIPGNCIDGNIYQVVGSHATLDFHSTIVNDRMQRNWK